MVRFDLPPGSTLDRFRILGVLGRGGMGVVYRGEDTLLARQVAIKVISRELASDPAFLSRFRREARAVGAVAHPNVIATHHAGEEGPHLFLVLELAPGGSLASKLRDGPLPWQQAVRWGAQVARGLEAIHALGMVHRDVKPENVLLDEHGNAKLSDFGIVRGDSLSGSVATKTGELLGTVEYMAPEQADGRGSKIDGRADLYALGATLHALVTGSPPFAGTGYVVLKRKLTEEPPALRSLAKDAPPALEELVRHLLGTTPDERPADAGAVAERLEALLAPPPARKPGMRRVALTVSGLAVVALGVALVTAWPSAPRAGPPPPAPPPPAPPPPAPAPRPAPPPAAPTWTLRLAWEVPGVPGKVISVAWTRDGETLLAIGEKAVGLIAAAPRARSVRRHLAGLGEVLWDVAVSPDATRILVNGFDGTVRLLAWRDGAVEELDAKPVYARQNGHAVAFSPSGKRAASSGEIESRGFVHRWDVGEDRLDAAGTFMMEPRTRAEIAPERLAFASEERLYATGMDGFVRVLDGTRLREKAPVNPTGSWLRRIVPLSGGRAVVGTWEQPPKLVALAPFRLLRELAHDPGTFTGSPAVTADEELALFAQHGEQGNRVVVDELATGRRVGAFSVPCDVCDVALSSRGLLAVAGEAEGRGFIAFYELTRP